jgi:hypothetical protein
MCRWTLAIICSMIHREFLIQIRRFEDLGFNVLANNQDSGEMMVAKDGAVSCSSKNVFHVPHWFQENVIKASTSKSIADKVSM